MRRILITGADSYVGVFVEKYLLARGDFRVDTVDMRDGSWRDASFAGYDAVFHVAGIAHADKGRISPDREALYYSVNTDLAVETAKKAKSEGVRQFIFMSSSLVYGDSAPVGKTKIITADTPVSPSGCYGESKVRAEKGILALSGDGFKVAVLRSPMIYGKGSKGNYPTLSRLARKMPVFPYVQNQRSMIYADNLAEFVRLVIVNGEEGVFHPQNAEYSNTSELVRMIAAAHGKRVILVRGFTWALKLMSVFTGLVSKAFGSLCYDMSLSEYKENYRIASLEESIEFTEK